VQQHHLSRIAAVKIEHRPSAEAYAAFGDD